MIVYDMVVGMDKWYLPALVLPGAGPVGVP